ncbi:hypothetical protein [Methylobacter svalbardensis]|uniref:hypothetical protein n=1 Tax=Methylobacter svalbardensis TaxID=3080016 RepID=UPI0030ECE808
MKVYQFNVYRKLIKSVFWIVVSSGSGFACQVLADEMSNINAHRFDHWDRASDSELDQLRGGFVLPNGVNIDFSLERITSLNGAVVSSSFFQLPGNASLFQNGNMNQAPDIAVPGLGSVIQNNLDNQIISTVTDINIAVSNLKNLNSDSNGMVINNLILPNMR